MNSELERRTVRASQLSASGIGIAQSKSRFWNRVVLDIA
jgi:hypothetical protein